MNATTTTSSMFHPISETIHKLSSLILPRDDATFVIHTTATATATKLAASSSTTFLAPLYETLHAHSRSTQHLYELEPIISALAIFFCRFVIINGSLTSSPDGHTSCLGTNRLEFVLRTSMALLLGVMAYMNIDYDLICCVHLWSHVVPMLLGWWWYKGCGTLCLMITGTDGGLGVGRVGKEEENDTVGEEKQKREKNRSSKKRKKHQLAAAAAAAAAEAETSSSPSSLVPSTLRILILSILLLLSLPSCLYLCRQLSNPTFLTTSLVQYTPTLLHDAFHYMFPITELTASYNIITNFVSNKTLLHDMICHLGFVTFHIQMGLGHIGIAFLTSEQRRKNMLIRMDVDNNEKDDDDNNNDEGKKKKKKKGEKSDISRKFRRSAPTFIFFTVLPYMFQIIFFGNLNKFAFIQVQNQIHRSVRIHELFDHDAHLTALASDGATAPGLYANSMDTVVATAYDMFNRKLFSLPKLILLPSIVARQPMLLVKIFPFIFLTDMLKGRIVASVTDKVEQFTNEARDVKAVRQKVEQFDMKNAELLRRSGNGAIEYTERRWDELTLEYQAKMVAGDLLKRTRGFFLWLQRNFVFVVLIDCALAKLLAEGSIAVAEIFVFSRAIEDVVDLLLIRSRSESELATLMSHVDKLKGLDEVWSKSKDARVLPCGIETALENYQHGTKQHSSSGASGGITLNNLQYSRGTASVSMEHLVIEPGIYAVTGANGSGKSTLFRLLMACDTNERPIDLHESIELGTPLHHWDLSDKLILPEDSCKAPDEGCDVIEKSEGAVEGSNETDDGVEAEEIPVTSIILPSSDIVEISQTFYWPLYSKPIDWIYQTRMTNEAERKESVLRVARELQSLSFAQALGDENESDGDESSVTKSNDAIIERLMDDLQEEKEDWFSDLSGGQKSKVELVRKVFLRDECPSVLLVDETMAPLDPASKSQVMSKLKDFCEGSVVLVIYHTDVGASDSDDDECVPSNSFFDHNLHVVDKHLTTRPVC